MLEKFNPIHKSPQNNPENDWDPPSTQMYDTPALFYAEERDNALEQLEKSKIDPVTGLKNRVAFEEDLPRAFGRGPLGVVYVDINSLNRVNGLEDGHEAGDRYLKGVAQALKNQLRFGQEIYRGGDKSDEIIIIAPDSNADDIIGFLDRIREAGDKAIDEMHLPEDTFPGISVGGAIKLDTDEDPKQLLGRADRHCEEEKNRFKEAVLQEYGVDLRR